MKKYRFHLLGLAYIPQSKKYICCAFTQKNLKLAKMLTSLGQEVFFYGSEGSDVKEYCRSENLRLIKTHTLYDIIKDYGDGDNRFEIGYDWNKGIRHDLGAKRNPSTLKFYEKCIEEINKIKKPDDFLLCTQGNYHKPIANAVNLFLTCDSGVGFRGSKLGWFRAFESSYIQNFTYGSEHPFASINGSYYDRVIPNYFDPNDVKYSDKKENYYLYIGRLINRKGIRTAYLATKALGAKLIFAGPAAHINSQGNLVDDKEREVNIPNDSNWEYVGFADLEKRKKLFAGAIATFTPTIYLEPFCGVHIESMLSGTPPITTNFGVFPETIPDYLNGKVGFRCDTLQDFVNAAKKAKKANHAFIRKYAERFLMDNVKIQYQKWFNDLYNVWESANDKTKKGWHRLKNSK